MTALGLLRGIDGIVFQRPRRVARAKSLACDVYDISEEFPKSEILGITSRLRRSAVSVTSNVAEGQGRLTKGEFLQFLGTARCASLEVVTQLEVVFTGNT